MVMHHRAGRGWPSFAWSVRGRVLGADGRPLIMGVLNITPDSFSDGGEHLDHGRAIEAGLRMVAQGTDILDIGGESTRPGAAAVPDAEEARRVTPVIAGLARQTSAVLSVDTSKHGVARLALDAGAHVVNDVTGLGDVAMAGVVRQAGAGLVVMHMRGTPRTMQNNPVYTDVAREVAEELQAVLLLALAAGIPKEAVAVDPGIGFAKLYEHNVELLRGLDALVGLGCPVLLGVSRKSFLGTMLGRKVDERGPGTLAAMGVALSRREAQILRVHDVAAARDLVAVWRELDR